jgi:hypothetical protein
MSLEHFIIFFIKGEVKTLLHQALVRECIMLLFGAVDSAQNKADHFTKALAILPAFYEH